MSKFYSANWKRDNFYEPPKWMSMPNYLQDCYYFSYSRCLKAPNCTYRHEIEALGHEQVCHRWLEGCCWNLKCPNRHMFIPHKRSDTPCYWEQRQPTGCTKPHCPFKHVDASRRSPAALIDPTASPLKLQMQMMLHQQQQLQEQLAASSSFLGGGDAVLSGCPSQTGKRLERLDEHPELLEQLEQPERTPPKQQQQQQHPIAVVVPDAVSSTSTKATTTEIEVLAPQVKDVKMAATSSPLPLDDAGASANNNSNDDSGISSTTFVENEGEETTEVEQAAEKASSVGIEKKVEKATIEAIDSGKEEEDEQDEDVMDGEKPTEVPEEEVDEDDEEDDDDDAAKTDDDDEDDDDEEEDDVDEGSDADVGSEADEGSDAQSDEEGSADDDSNQSD